MGGEEAGQRGRVYRVPPPAAEKMIRWPDDFGTRFTLFVDTEEEFDWFKPIDRAARGTSHMRQLPAAHAYFADHGVPICYLVDHPIATCAQSVGILQELLDDKVSSIGTQLHPWVNPPFDETVSRYNSFVGNLPLALQEQKLAALTASIRAAFGASPIAYRAGRYGIGPDTLQLLARHGYRVDTSMRASYSYADQGGPDFSDISNHAFRAGDVIELPLTTVFRGWGRAGGVRLHQALATVPTAQSVASRIGMLSRVSLTPEGMPVEEAKEAVRVAVGEGLRLLNFSFHSPSIEPGHTPYVRDLAGLRSFYCWWDAIFSLLDQLGVRPIALPAIVSAADACSTA